MEKPGSSFGMPLEKEGQKCLRCCVPWDADGTWVESSEQKSIKGRC